tara:strand:+ start:10112 stop:10621 length:510 start_codon:yes stop_codon:yes gene_type:complete
MNNKIIILFLLILSTSFSHEVVDNLNLEKFMGRWYVISLIPNWIEEDASNSYDEYTLNKDGTVDIFYQAIKKGKTRTIKQRATVLENPAIWEIQFIKPWVPFFKAPYEVIILDEDYNYMVVGYPNNDYGWIMSRTTSLEDSIYKKILSKLETDFGYSKENFKKVIHDSK